MKKAVVLLLALVLCVFAVSCNVSGKDTTGKSSEEASASSKITDSSEAEKLTESDLKTLFDENIKCFTDIFMINTLPVKDNAVKDNIFEVDSKDYTDYAAFENYIKSVYSESGSDLLLNKYPYEDSTLYVNVDGKLCINKDNIRPKGYFVDWSDYKIAITDSSDSECKFTVTAKITEPSDNPTPEDYPLEASAVKENGKWLLTKMFY